MKTCTKCGIEKEFNEFSKQSKNKSGLFSHCKICNKINRNNNKEKRKLVKKEWYLNNKERLKTYDKEYKSNNKDKVSTTLKKWQDKNKDYVKNKSKIYIKNNLGKIYTKNARYRACKLNASVPGFDKEIEAIYTKALHLQNQDGIKRHVHHIIPLQEYNHLGIFGLHIPSNLEILTEEEHKEAHKKLKEQFKVM